MKYAIGKFYRVPTIKVRGVVLPILGPLHEDVEIIGFENEHWHVDPRFMSDWATKRYLRRLPLPLQTMQKVVAQLLEFPVSVRVVCADISSPWPVGFLHYGEIPEVLIRRRKCYREMPLWGVELRCQAKMEAAYAGYRLKDLDNPICPHRGIPLSGLQERDGVVECPGHGLCWSLRTGQLVKVT